MKSSQNQIRLARTSLLLALAAIPSAYAADTLWSGATTGTLDWNTATNWTGNATVNSTADRADLRADWATAPTIALSAPVSVNGILFNDTGASGDTTLTIGNGGNAANTLTLGGSNPSLEVLSTTLTISANLTGTSGFTKSGGSSLALSASNTGFSGNVTVSGGTLRLTNGTALNSGSVVQVNSGTTLDVNSSNTIAGLNDNAGSGGTVGNTGGGGRVLTIGGTGAYSFSGNITGSASTTRVGLVLSGSGTQTLGGTNNSTGYQTVTGGGTLVFAKQNSIFQGLATGAVVNANLPASAGIAVMSGTVALGVGDSASGYFDSTAIGTFLDASHMGLSSNSTGFRNNSILGLDTTNATGGTFTYSTALANIGTSTGIGFAKLGAGTLILDAANTYGGVTQVRAGTLQIGAGSTTGAIGSTADITVSSGATLAFNRTDTALSQSNKITGAGSVSQNGTGTTTLTASTSDYSGGTSISAGRLIASSIGSGTIAISGTATQLNLSRNATYSNAITITGALGRANEGLIDTAAGINATLSGPISISASSTNGGHFGSSGSGSLTVTGAITSSVPVVFARRGTGVFSNGGTGYTALQVRAGTVRLGGINGLATSSSVAIGGDGNAVLDLNGFNQSLVGLSKGASGATVTNNGAVDAVLTTTGTSSFAGVISDGSTNKLGVAVASGFLTLSGNNTYTGGTIVNGGSLFVNSATGAGNGGITVNSGVLKVNATIGNTITLSGGTLSGNATLAVDLALSSTASVISPGNSPGITSFSTTQNWSAYTYDWEINNFTGTGVGTAFDNIAITTGGLNLAGGTSYVLNVLSLTSGNVSGTVPNFGESSVSWSIITTQAGITAFDAGKWTINSSAFAVLNGSTGTFSLALTNSGKDLSLVYTPIPEPSAYATAFGAAAVAFAAIRRRRRTSTLSVGPA